MFELLVEKAPDAIIVVGSDGLIRLVNRQTEVLFGYSREELTGRSVEQLIPDRLASHHPQLRTGFFDKPSVRAMGAGLELAARRKDGTEFPVDISLSPLETEDGMMVFAAVRDITQRKRAEAKFQGLLESAPDAIVVMGSDGLIRLVNRQTEVLFGYSRQELLGRSVEQLIPDRLASHHPQLRTGFFDKPSVRAMGAGLELAARRKDGTEFPVDISLSPLETEEGVLVSAAVRDVTDRKRLESELEAARDQALEASRLKSDFLANMSHEIRTPMNAVIGMTGLLLDTDLGAGQREYAEAVRSAGEALLQIINDILDFSKIEAGKMRLEVMDFDLRTVVEEVADLLASRAHERNLELVTVVSRDASTMVRGDPGRVRQILTNLVGNAIKFTDRGEVVVRVSPVAGNAGRTVLMFEVEDTGIGISEDRRGLLFQPFEQLDSSVTRRHGGTGLGLAISKELVEMMGGEIGVDSVPGAGSRFWFSLPLPPAEKQPSPVSSRHDLEGLSVLLVDDNASSRKVLEEQLRGAGLIVAAAAEGPEALLLHRQALAEGRSFDLALVDSSVVDSGALTLPALAGADATHSAEATRIIVMTPPAQRMEEQDHSPGVSALLPKPVRGTQLAGFLSMVMGKSPGSPPDVFTPGRPNRPQRPHGGTRLLVAEDNPMNQLVATRMLENLGYRVDVVANGREALDALVRIDYAAVLMDCQMPELDGFEATRELRRREVPPRRTPVIAMTAGAMQSDRQQCLDADMDDYLSKPVKPQELEAVLSKWISYAQA
ncbi:MAG TPA: PAS domain S-box protein [Actinomycetota bacterium]|nr:PAS domain S-box protein [Actinomycetota bacterium]